MKKTIVIFLVFALFASSCEKQELFDQLKGNWEIISVSGSILGSQPIRDFDHIQFTHSGSYSVLFNGTVIQGGTFYIEKQKYKNPISNKYDYQLVLNQKFNNHPYADFYSEFPFSMTFNEDGTLTLRQLYISDGFQYDFKRD